MSDTRTYNVSETEVKLETISDPGALARIFKKAWRRERKRYDTLCREMGEMRRSKVDIAQQLTWKTNELDALHKYVDSLEDEVRDMRDSASLKVSDVAGDKRQALIDAIDGIIEDLRG